MFIKCIVLTVLFIHTCQAVTNGHEVLPHQYPYQVAIYSKFPLLVKNHLVCGGVILTPSWILTSAQCISKFNCLSVRAGKHNLSMKEAGQQIRSVDSSFKHDDYKAPWWFRKIAQNDIALLKLDKPLTLTEQVQPIALPAPGTQHNGVGVLSGWGQLADGQVSNSLQSVQVSFLDTGKCTEVISEFHQHVKINKGHICTGFIGGHLSACSTDLGGPLVQYQADASAQLVGIVSWADVPCGVLGLPTVYTRVSSYVNWIHEILETE